MVHNDAENTTSEHLLVVRHFDEHLVGRKGGYCVPGSALRVWMALLLHSKPIQPSPGILCDSPKQNTPRAVDVTDLAERVEEHTAEEKF